MKWPISLLALALGFVVALGAVPGRKVDWSKLKPREVWPNKLQSELKGMEMQLHSMGRENQNGRIIGGNEVSPGSYPYQAGLVIDIFYWCGGILISDLYVLTAAHCTYMSFEIDVYLGAHNIRQSSEEGREVITVQFKNIITHEDYDPNWLLNDIGLIMLNTRIKFTDRISPIRLATRTEAKHDLELKRTKASGWGRPSDSAGSISDVLMAVDLRVQPKVVCQHFFREAIQPTNICTDTGRGQGTCNGDSGGPLVLTNPGNASYLVGLTSFGSAMACVAAGWPSVFTYVPAYLNWIRDNTDIIIRE